VPEAARAAAARDFWQWLLSSAAERIADAAALGSEDAGPADQAEPPPAAEGHA
jgi:hypothetical protein